MRELLSEKVVDLLRKKGFQVSTFFDTNSCFDIIAKSEKLTLLIKIYNNIDGLRQENADELKKLEQLFKAEALIIGEKTKAFELNSGIVYDRYGIPVLNVDSFKNLLNEKIPYIKYFKGKKIVEIDSDLLREARKKTGLTLEEVAGKVNLAKDTLHRFEVGSNTSLETALNLEKYFNCEIIKKPELFHKKEIDENDLYSDEFNDNLLEKIRDLGIKLTEFKHAPFQAYSDPLESLLIGTGKRKTDIYRRAFEIKKTSKIIDSHPVIISKEFKQLKVDDVPVIEEEELTTLKKSKDLLKLLKERENDA